MPYQLVSLTLCSLWIDRIPFILLFGIKTSIELFQEKLPRRSIRCLRGVKFDVAEISVDVMFRAVSFNKTRPFLLGPGVSSLILQAQQESIQGIASFAKSLQVRDNAFGLEMRS